MHPILIALLLVGMAGQAWAGAWPRQKGSAFVSFSHSTSTGTPTLLTPEFDLNNYSSVFAEYGLTDKITIGLDAGFGGDNMSTVRSGYVFVRHPIAATDSGHRFAGEIGLGRIEDNSSEAESIIRPGLSWGYGFESRWGPGWMGIESSAGFRSPSGDTIYKADLTLGLKPTENWMLIFQVQNGLYPDADPLVRIAPSVVRKLNDHAHIQLGTLVGVTGDDSIGAKLGVWISF